MVRHKKLSFVVVVVLLLPMLLHFLIPLSRFKADTKRLLLICIVVFQMGGAAGGFLYEK